MKIIGGLEDRPCWAANLEESHLTFCIIQLTTWDTVEKKDSGQSREKIQQNISTGLLKIPKTTSDRHSPSSKKHCLNTKKGSYCFQKSTDFMFRDVFLKSFVYIFAGFSPSTSPSDLPPQLFTSSQKVGRRTARRSQPGGLQNGRPN